MTGWLTTTIESACNVEYGTRVVQKRDGGSTFPVYGGGGATFFMDTANRANRVVVARFGMSEACTRYVSGDFFLNDSGLTLSPRDTGALLPEFLDQQTLALNDEIFALGKGTAQKNLDVSAFRSLRISYPESIAEQRRIVAILDEAFDGIATAKANAEKNLQNSREFFESFLDSSLTRHESGCVETVLGDEADLLAGYAFSSKGYADSRGGVRLLRGDNIMQGYLRWDDAKYWPSDDVQAYERFVLREGDVVLAMDRPWVKAGLKRAQISANDLPCLQLQRTARLRPRSRLRMDFLFHLVGSRLFSQHLLGVQTGLGVPHVSGKQIESFRFMLPSMRDQASIAAKLDELHQCIVRLEMLYEQKKSSLEELKKSILDQAFAGRLVGSNR